MWSRLRNWTGWGLSWIFFGTGYATSYIAHRFDLTAPVLGPTSQVLFQVSSIAQDWGGGYGAWEDCIEVDLEKKCATCGNGPGSHSIDCPLGKE